jgi:hypothetical protein
MRDCRPANPGEPGRAAAQASQPQRTFPVDRGVIQGAIDSPWFFIVALECIFRRCDTDGGIDLGLPSGNILRLEYADDAALLCRTNQEATLRLTRIAVGSRHYADMEGSRPKTEAQVTEKRETLPMPSEMQAPFRRCDCN